MPRVMNWYAYSGSEWRLEFTGSSQTLSSHQVIGFSQSLPTVLSGCLCPRCHAERVYWNGWAGNARDGTLQIVSGTRHHRECVSAHDHREALPEVTMEQLMPRPIFHNEDGVLVNDLSGGATFEPTRPTMIYECRCPNCTRIRNSPEVAHIQIVRGFRHHPGCLSCVSNHDYHSPALEEFRLENFPNPESQMPENDTAGVYARCTSCARNIHMNVAEGARPRVGYRRGIANCDACNTVNLHYCDLCHPHYRCSGCNTDRTASALSGIRCDDCRKCQSCCSCVRNCIHCGNGMGDATRNIAAPPSGRTACRDRDHQSRWRERDTLCNQCCRACARGYDFWRPEEVVFHIGRNLKAKTKRFMSAEVETNYIAPPVAGTTSVMDVVKKWSSAVVSDGSVRACEINTAPASGDKWVEQITELCESLNRQKASVDTNCGTHVHIDSRDFNFYDLRKYVILWRLVEDGMFAIVHPNRATGSYSAPCSARLYEAMQSARSPKEVKQSFFIGAYGSAPSKSMNRKTLARSKNCDNRYSALNVHSWMYRGTFENRMHHGTVNAEKIINWGLVNAYLIDFAFNNPESLIRSLGTPREAKRNSYGDIDGTLDKNSATAEQIKASVEIIAKVMPTSELSEWVIRRRTEVTKNYRTSCDP